MNFLKMGSSEFLTISRWARWTNLKIFKNSKVLRMEFSIVENLSGLCGSIFNLFRGPQLDNSCEKLKNNSFFSMNVPNFPVFSLLPHVGQWLFGIHCCCHSCYQGDIWRIQIPARCLLAPVFIRFRFIS